MLNALLLFAACVNAQAKGQITALWGPFFQAGPSGTYILQSETTLYAPNLPSTLGTGNALLIWAGQPTDKSDRYQAVLESKGNNGGVCNARKDQWCAYDRSFTQVGQSVAVSLKDVADGIVMRLQYNPTTGKNLQTMYTTTAPPRFLGALENSHGKPMAWRTGIECQGRCQNVDVGSHQWINTTIWLSKPDPSFGANAQYNQVWTTTPLQTSDGGKTWRIQNVAIPPVKIGDGKFKLGGRP